MLEVLLTLVFDIQVICKLTIMFIEQRKISTLYKVVEEEFWDTSILNPESAIDLDNHFKNIFRFAQFHFISSGIAGVVVMSFPPTEYPDGMKNLPWLLYFPFDPNPSPLHELLFAALAFSGIFCLFTVYVYDYQFIYFAQHLIVQLKMLKIMLENITTDIEGGDDVKKFHSATYQKEVYRRMGICAKHHDVLLRFGRNLMDLASVASGVQYFFSIFLGVVIECLIGWAMETGNILRSVKLSTVLMCMYNEITIFAYHGSEIQEESSSVATAAYKSEWYHNKARLRKGLVFMQMNSQELKIMGFKLFEINNNTVVTIIRTTFSIVTLLRAMN